MASGERVGRWEWVSPGPSVDRRRRCTPIEGFVKNSSRAKLGPRKVRASKDKKAIARRQRREELGPPKKVIESQLKEARRRLKSHVFCPNRDLILDSKPPLAKSPIAMGDKVKYVPPGPRKARNNAPASGKVLEFPDAKGHFVAVLRGTWRLLCNIDVVPLSDCWVVG